MENIIYLNSMEYALYSTSTTFPDREDIVKFITQKPIKKDDFPFFNKLDQYKAKKIIKEEGEFIVAISNDYYKPTTIIDDIKYFIEEYTGEKLTNIDAYYKLSEILEVACEQAIGTRKKLTAISLLWYTNMFPSIDYSKLKRLMPSKTEKNIRQCATNLKEKGLIQYVNNKPKQGIAITEDGKMYLETKIEAINKINFTNYQALDKLTKLFKK